MRPIVMNARLAPLAFAIALVAGACGSSSEGIDVVDTLVTTDTVVTTDPAVAETDPPAVTFLSEPVDAGSLFGNAAEQAADSATSPAEEPCLDEDDCGRREPDVRPPTQPFKPATEDEPFCTLLAELEDRPFPSDENEALVVILAWFGELEPTVPPAHEEDFALLIFWLEQVAQSQGQLGLDDIDPEVGAASVRFGDYVDANCHGVGLDNQDSPPPPPPTQPGTQPVTTSNETDERLAGPIFGDEARDQFERSGVPTLSPIERRAVDAPFCAAIDEIAQRAMPRGDIEQMILAQTWLVELAPFVPDAVADQYATVSAWVDGIVDAQSFEEADEPETGDIVDLAVDALNIYVDENCYGY